jgi:hypothetical protein
MSTAKPEAAARGTTLLLGAATQAGALEIPVRSETLKTAAARPAQIGELLNTYSAAVERSRLMQQPVSFVVDVGPRGEPTFRAIVVHAPDRAPRDEDDLEAALAAARDRGRVRVAEILAGPEMLAGDAFAALVGASRVTVNSWRRNRQVLALEGAKRGYRFPAWQVGDDGKPFAALPALFDRLGGAWAVYRFLVQHHAELDGQTGREALRRGRAAQALEAAESVSRGAG